MRRRFHRRPHCVPEVVLVPSDTSCDRFSVGTRAIGQYRRCSAATCLLIPDGLRCDAPVEDLIKGIRCIRRSASIGFTTHRARLLNYRPELAEQRPVQDSTTIHPGPGVFLFAPLSGIRATVGRKPTKRERENRTLCKAVPSTTLVGCCWCCCWTVGPWFRPDRHIALQLPHSLLTRYRISHL